MNVGTETGPAGRRKRVAVMISGRGSNLSALISASMAADYPCRIVAVISDNPEATGLELARECEIETHTFARADFADRTAHEDAILAELDAIKPDFICLAGYMRLLSAEFVNRWRGLMLNVHPSLLPSFPGLDTHQRVLAHQVRIHGCSVHFVTEGMDEGPLVAQAAVRVMPEDTEETLAARVLTAEHRLYPAALRLVATGKVRMTDAGATVFNGLAAEDDGAMLQSPAESG